MPSRRGLEQSLTWLKSKMAEKDTLDAVNAEVCYNVLMDLKKRKEVIEALYHIEKVRSARKDERTAQEEIFAPGTIPFPDE